MEDRIKKAKSEKLMVKAKSMALQLPPEGLKLHSGGFLSEVVVSYECFGKLNASKDNVILVCTPLTMDAHIAGWYSEEDKEPGWWDEMIGPNKAINTDNFFVIGSNILGGCGGTTGPSSLDPATGSPYGSHFPTITIQDIVKVQNLLIEQLGVQSLAAVIGGSLGGMQALEWSIAYPDKVKKCMCIAASTHLSPQALGFEIVGRKILLNDKNYAHGDYYDFPDRPDTGLAFARMIGLLTYLSPASMHQKFSRSKDESESTEKFETGYDVENYLDYNAKKFVNRFDANSYLHITYAMDTYNPIETYGSIEKAFEKSSSEFLLVALSSDWLFPPSESKRLCKTLLNIGKIASIIELDSPYGHDAFLLEVEYLKPVIHSFLTEELETKQDRVDKINALSTAFEDTPPEVPVLFNLLDDFKYIESLIEPKSHILDIGCGDGKLIDTLYRLRGATGYGIDINLESLVHCLFKNVPIVHGDVDDGLNLFGDQSFDYAVLNQTMQMLKKPDYVLKEMLRVAQKGIVVFPNFANINNRLAILSQGVMPISKGLPYNWWESPNIHLFTYKDFQVLCESLNIQIEQSLFITNSFLSKGFCALGFNNLGAELVIAKISRSSGY